jgi:hypothetical protein
MYSRTIEKHGRSGCRPRLRYGRRSLVETVMFRYKTIIGGHLQIRSLPDQKTEARTRYEVLDRTVGLDTPISVLIK